MKRDPGSDRTNAGRPKSQSERQARLRARQRRGELVAPVPVSTDGIAVLLSLGWLRVKESEDRTQIGAAIGLMLAELARHHAMKKA